MEAPRSYHLATVKYLLWYISGTIMHECVYQRGDGENLVGYSDSDLGGDVGDHKSTTGSLFFLDKSPINWQSTIMRGGVRRRRIYHLPGVVALSVAG